MRTEHLVEVRTDRGKWAVRYLIGGERALAEKRYRDLYVGPGCAKRLVAVTGPERKVLIKEFYRG
jgi:hypothetical protein